MLEPNFEEADGLGISVKITENYGQNKNVYSRHVDWNVLQNYIFFSIKCGVPSRYVFVRRNK